MFSLASLANRGKNAPALNAKDIKGGHSLGPRTAIVKIGGAAESIGEIDDTLGQGRALVEAVPVWTWEAYGCCRSDPSTRGERSVSALPNVFTAGTMDGLGRPWLG